MDGVAVALEPDVDPELDVEPVLDSDDVDVGVELGVGVGRYCWYSFSVPSSTGTDTSCDCGPCWPSWLTVSFSTAPGGALTELRTAAGWLLSR